MALSIVCSLSCEVVSHVGTDSDADFDIALNWLQQNQPAAMFSQDRSGNSQQAVYNNMRPATSGTVLSQFSVPPGMKCTTSDDLPALPKAALWV
jgi:hypothetical protein